MGAAQVPISRWVNKTWDIYIIEYYLAIKKENFTFCDSMDRPREHYIKWNKTVRERQIPYDFEIRKDTGVQAACHYQTQ